MALIDLMKDKYKVVSVVGMAKNAGKTVALNEIIHQSTQEGLTLGLTSIGRDGESEDIVTWTQKPTIYVEKGTLIATAEGLYNLSQARLEILEMTEFGTSMGTIMIARTLSSGNVQLAGPCSNVDVRTVSNRMLEYGAGLVIVDGALDRMSSASPTISDAAILSTGAVISRDMDKVVEQSIHQVSLFHLPVLPEKDVRKIAKKMAEGRDICLIDEGESELEIRCLETRTALGAGRQIGDSIEKRTRYIIIPGSLVEKTLFDVADRSRYFKNVVFIIQDATRIFVQSKPWQILLRKGLKVMVLSPIHLLALTVNPFSPSGYYFDPVTFRTRLANYLEPLPVINVMEGD